MIRDLLRITLSSSSAGAASGSANTNLVGVGAAGDSKGTNLVGAAAAAKQGTNQLPVQPAAAAAASVSAKAKPEDREKK